MTEEHVTDASRPVLILVDGMDGELRDSALELATLARGLGPVVAVTLVPPGGEALDRLGRYGVQRVLHVRVEGADQDPSRDPRLTAVAARAVASAVEHAAPQALLATASFANKEISARVAWLTGAGLVIDVTGIAPRDGADGGPLVGSKRVFAGSWDLACAVRTGLAVFTVRANAVEARPAGSTVEPVVEELTTRVPDEQARVRLVSRHVHPEHPGAHRPALAEAAIVVAGGRGTGGDFGPVEDLADALGAAVGSTRDAVDEGWIEHDTQIGQTGVTIAARLYIGAGISGAPHHRGGMQASEVVVAVNNDPEAPLFEIADLAIVGDLSEVLPRAAARIRERRAREQAVADS